MDQPENQELIWYQLHDAVMYHSDGVLVQQKCYSSDGTD